MLIPQYMLRGCLILLMNSILIGCCGLNAFIDERKEFERLRNKEIGKVVSNIPKNSQTEEIINGEPVVAEVNNWGGSNSCRYEYLISLQSKKIVAWRYVANQEKCTNKRFYCGAW